MSSTEQWDALDWKTIHFHVRKIQKRIAEAALSGDWKRVSRLQKLVFASWDCRVIAVHRVTCKQNIRTPGIDGRFWPTDAERFAAVDKLRDYQHYSPMPFKRTYVPKEHDKNKKRPLSVPVIFDRAMQGLILIGVDPVIECTAGIHDYGFRMYRSSQDTIRDVRENFGFTTGHPYVLKTDIHQCFDHVSHEWILEHSPMNKKLLRKILKCGYVHDGVYYPMEEGVPQGGVLSPALTNLVLNGFGKTVEKYQDSVRFVRFVDDFLFSGTSVSVLESVLAELKEFLAERGLELSEAKTSIRHISEGVDFIGWHFQRYADRLEITPTEQSTAELKKRIADTIFQGINWTARKLILKLNGYIRGWGMYHVYLCTADPFTALDDYVQDLLWQWACTRHPKHNPKWIYRHCWHYQESTGKREFSSGDAVLFHFVDQKVRIKNDFDLSKNPYLELSYFRNRQKRYVQTESCTVLKYRRW